MSRYKKVKNIGADNVQSMPGTATAYDHLDCGRNLVEYINPRINLAKKDWRLK